MLCFVARHERIETSDIDFYNDVKWLKTNFESVHRIDNVRDSWSLQKEGELLGLIESMSDVDTVGHRVACWQIEKVFMLGARAAYKTNGAWKEAHCVLTSVLSNAEQQ